MSVETTRVANADNAYSVVIKDECRLLWVHVTYTSTATAGNRQLRLGLKDASGNKIWDSHAGAVQAASNVYDYFFLPGIYRETSFVDSSIQVSIPVKSFIPGNYTFFVEDNTDVDASDTFVLTYQTEKI